MSFQLSQGTHNTFNFAILPFRVLVMIYRPDLHSRAAQGNVASAGEACCLCGFTQSLNGGALSVNVIFEYALEATSEAEL